MTYFRNVNTIEELRRQFRDLLKKHHPDNGGNEDIAKEINAEYDVLFKILKDKHESKTSAGAGAESNSKKYNDNTYNYEEDVKLREVIQKIIHFTDISIEICGSWIWVSGNTYQYRKELKEIGFMWASQKKQWYWHSDAYVKKSRKTLSMQEIRNYYGSTEVKPEERKKLAQA